MGQPRALGSELTPRGLPPPSGHFLRRPGVFSNSHVRVRRDDGQRLPLEQAAQFPLDPAQATGGLGTGAQESVWVTSATR